MLDLIDIDFIQQLMRIVGVGVVAGVALPFLGFAAGAMVRAATKFTR